jgi:hypothetical protein
MRRVCRLGGEKREGVSDAGLSELYLCNYRTVIQYHVFIWVTKRVSKVLRKSSFDARPLRRASSDSARAHCYKTSQNVVEFYPQNHLPMFHYTAVDPRTNYLAAVANAEAEFLAAQRQEQALRQIHLEGYPLGHSVFQSTHQPFDAYGGRHAYYGHDRLASLRRQIEEEERRKLEEEKRLAVALLLQQAELALESRRSQEEERARVRLALEREKYAAHLRERLALAIQDYQQVSQLMLLSFIRFLTRCRSHASSSARGHHFTEPTTSSKQKRSLSILSCNLF